MDFELESFWMSAESPYWPCKKKILQKVEVDCLMDADEHFLKRIIKLVYHSYQESSVRVDGTTNHISSHIENILTDQTKYTVSPTWTVKIFPDVDFEKDVQNEKETHNSRRSNNKFFPM